LLTPQLMGANACWKRPACHRGTAPRGIEAWGNLRRLAYRERVPGAIDSAEITSESISNVLPSYVPTSSPHRRVKEGKALSGLDAASLRLLTDRGRVSDLHPLGAGAVLVPVQVGSETDLGTALVSIYPSPDEARELPVHTFRDYVLA
jgi:hypothetical protein